MTINAGGHNLTKHVKNDVRYIIFDIKRNEAFLSIKLGNSYHEYNPHPIIKIYNFHFIEIFWYLKN